MDKQYGYTVNQIDYDKAICLNDKKLVSTMEGTNRLGTYIKDGVLYHDGIPLVDSSDEVPQFDGENSTFGSTKLSTIARQCINITIDNYNKLLRGETVKDYKPYSREDVYYLVTDVDTADVISYTEEEEGYRFGDILWREKFDVLYNNVIGVRVPTSYDIDFEHNTFCMDRPYVSIRHFNPVINYDSENVSNNKIALKVRVSDQEDSVLNYDTIGPRYKDDEYVDDGIYKLIVKTEDGNMVEKYCYPGTICIDTPTFSLTGGENRETWFSIQCIDSRGVASVEHFLDVYIKANATENILDISDDDSVLGEYGIVTDIDNTVIGYENKKALSNLFADAKSKGYNGIKLPKRNYYLDYHKKIGEIAEDPDAPDTPDVPSENTFRFLHFSDPHTCVDSVNKCKELMEGDPSINVTILTGDYANLGQVITVNADMDNTLRNFNNPLLVLNGNHEGWDTRVNTTQSYLKGIITEDGVVWGDDDADNANNKGRYYYIDYPLNGNKLRILCVDQYQLVGSSYPLNWKPAYSQDEIDWLISKISELDADDYLLIALHEPPIAKSENIGPRRENDWCSANLKTWSGFVDSGNVIPMIMQAYMDKQALSQRVLNYIDPEGVNTDTIGINVDVDFTDNTPCTFVGYICGHIHGDMHTYHPDYPEQLILCIDWANDASNNKPYWSDIFASTTPRRKDGVLINDVTLDFDNKKIKVKRIGNGSGVDGYGVAESMTVDDVTYQSVARTTIEFPFKKKQQSFNKLSGNKVVDLGSQTYYYVKLANGYISEYEELSNGINDVIADIKEIFRYPTDSGIEAINQIAAQVDDNGKRIICFIGDDTWNYLLQNNNVAYTYLKDNYKYLRTFKLDYDIDYYLKNNVNLLDETLGHTLPSKVKDRELYFVRNTASPVKMTNSMTSEQFTADNLVFPDNFTVDMNGSKFIAATTYDVDDGELVKFYKNTDTHIKNGAFVGLYTKFKDPNGDKTKDLSLKFHLATAHNTVGEGMSLFAMRISRYCSIDNVEISGSLGYECVTWSTGFGSQSSNLPVDILENNTYINARGELVVNENIEMVTTTKYTLSNSSKDVLYGRDGYFGYTRCGLRPEIFAVFYDAYNRYLTTITTKLYAGIKIPNGAKYVRFVGYGTRKHSNESDILASNWSVSLSSGTIGAKQPRFSVGCEFKNLYVHDTRTTALTNPQGHQLLYDNITYERCATTKYLGISAGGSITPLLGDFEDSWQIAKYITVSNCKAIKDTDQYYTSSRTLLVYNCEHFDFVNNEGFGLTHGGGIESGLIAGNTFGGWTINKTRGCFHPHVEMRDNVASRVTVTVRKYDSVKMSEKAIYSTSEGEELPSVLPDDVSEDSVLVRYQSLYIDTDYNDRIEPMIAFANSTFKIHVQYDYFKLRKCKSETVGVDYVN